MKKRIKVKRGVGTHVMLKALEDYPEVSLYYDRDEGGFYYSRDGKRFSPKEGCNSLVSAEEYAVEAEEKRLAAKRVPPSLRFAVWAPSAGRSWGERGGRMYTVGKCSGYSLQSGREGLTFTQDAPEEHTSYSRSIGSKEPYYLSGNFGNDVFAFIEGDPAIERIAGTQKKIEDLESRLFAMKTMQESDIEESGTKLPPAPSDKASRVKQEIKLVAAVEGMGERYGVKREFRFAITMRDDGNFYRSSLKIPERWDKTVATSAHEVLEQHFGGAIWTPDFILGVGKYEDSTHFRKIEDNDCVVYGFKHSANNKTWLIIRDVTRPYQAKPPGPVYQKRKGR